MPIRRNYNDIYKFGIASILIFKENVLYYNLTSGVLQVINKSQVKEPEYVRTNSRKSSP